MTGLKADLAVILFNDSKLLNVPFTALGDCLLPISPVHLLRPCPFFKYSNKEGPVVTIAQTWKILPQILHASTAAHPLR